MNQADKENVEEIREMLVACLKKRGTTYRILDLQTTTFQDSRLCCDQGPQ